MATWEEMEEANVALGKLIAKAQHHRGGLGYGQTVPREVAELIKKLSDQRLDERIEQLRDMPDSTAIRGLAETLREMVAVRFARDRDREWLREHRPPTVKAER